MYRKKINEIKKKLSVSKKYRLSKKYHTFLIEKLILYI